MNWGSLGAFVDMGGYGLFVWGSYGAAVLCIAIELMALKQRARRLARHDGQMGHASGDMNGDGRTV
jgi:heme exporter protein D